MQGNQICPAPADAYNVSSRYEQVGRAGADGETVHRQAGSIRAMHITAGTRLHHAISQRTVYDDVCYYTVIVGAFGTVAADSVTSANLAWPVTNLNSAVGNSSRCTGLLPVLGCEKEGTRKESYQAVITMDNGRTQTCDVPFDEWQQITVETTFTFKVRIVGGGIDCSTLQRTG